MCLTCKSDERRDAVRQLQGWNGIDYVEVGTDRRVLTVFFLGKLPPELSVNGPALTARVAIDGGERITGIRVLDVDPVASADPEIDDQLIVRVDQVGDFSTYTLRLVGVERLDPRYATATFSFRVDCPTDLDCGPSCDCDPPALAEPEINYLAKDYQSFRQLILDRMALNVPGWTERHVPDLGVALVEVLAYEGDFLSYYQDAVATEAYLETARQRISVRRHARLVDYALHDGCNARALLTIAVDTTLELDPTTVSFVTGLNRAIDARTVLQWDDLAAVPAAAYEVFEPFDRSQTIRLNPAHNAIRFHTWGNRECCLDAGATSATLIDTGLSLAVGDWLIFEEVRGPVTGVAGDADPTHRHAVRLTGVTQGVDPVIVSDEGTPLAYVRITWSDADALPFPLCISAIGGAPACHFLDDISVARGNVVLVDHGRTIGPEPLGTVPERPVDSCCVCEGRPADVQHAAGRFSPALAKAPLTFRQALDPATTAAMALVQDPRLALPQLMLTSEPAWPWETRADLVASTGTDAHLVVEMDNDGVAHLRFGDGTLGRKPDGGMSFAATYRVGNGTAGNVGAESISLLVLRNLTLDGVSITIRNPLAARGGIDGEVMAEAKLFAPHAFRTRIERAIIAADYEELAERNGKVQRASAALVWTGSWYEADVAIDPLGGEALPDALRTAVSVDLERYRRMGHDLHVRPAEYVPIDLRLAVCAAPGYQRAHVRAALLDLFSNRRRRDGSLGFFHPDRQSFGEGIYLSVVIALCMAVPGVQSVTVTRLQRLFAPANREIENGVLPLASNEIAQLDNDPDFPEHGQLVIDVQGGR